MSALTCGHEWSEREQLNASTCLVCLKAEHTRVVQENLDLKAKLEALEWTLREATTQSETIRSEVHRLVAALASIQAARLPSVVYGGP